MIEMLRELNTDERSLLWTISRENGATKESLARKLPWGSTKLNTYLAALRKKGAVSADTLSKDGTGRKPLSFSPAAAIGYFVGVQCNLRADYYALVDGTGTLVAERTLPTEEREGSGEERFIDRLAEFLDSAAGEGIPARGIAISSAIRFNDDSASRRSPSYTNDAIRPIADRAEARFGIPVSVGRPQVLLCHQRSLRSHIAERESFINIIATDNLGIAIFVNGESWLGQSGLSGDLGHLKIPGNRLPCYCGATGCLRTKLSYMGICGETRRRLSDIAAAGGTPSLDPRGFEGPDFEAGAAALVAAANSHDATATAVLLDAATELGTALATVISLFNPERLFVHSILSEAVDIFAEQVRGVIRKNCLELYSRDLTLEFKGYSPRTNAEGAAMFARSEYLRRALDIS